MKEVFILGAGFSKAIYPEMPLLNELGKNLLRREVWQPSNNEIEELEYRFGKDVELWLTFLSEEQPWLDEIQNLKNRALFLQISRKIQKEILIKQTEFNNNIKQSSPEWLEKLIEYWYSKQSIIISLNYDTLLENVAIAQKPGKITRSLLYPIKFPDIMTRDGVGMLSPGDYSEFQTFTICKLHGSLNWLYSGRKDFYGETIYLADEAEKMIPDQNAAMLMDKIPLIIPPTANKTNSYFQNESIRAIWNIAKQALEQADNIYVIGYSLPKTDLMMRLFLRDIVLKRLNRTYVVNISDSVQLKKHFEEMLPTTTTIDLSYAGKMDAIEEFVGRLIGDELVKR